VENKWKNYHIITFPGESLPERQTNAKCFLWRQNNLEVNYHPTQISRGRRVRALPCGRSYSEEHHSFKV
jgi:hypothetical protein